LVFVAGGIVCEKVVLQVKIVLEVQRESGLSCFDGGDDWKRNQGIVPVLSEEKAKTKYRGPSLRSG
jgi:hypothetical protein